MEEATKKKLGDHILQLIFHAKWRKPNATAVVRVPVAGETVPAARFQQHATHSTREQYVTPQNSITGNEELATAEANTPAPASGVNNRYSRDYIPKLPLNYLLDVKLPIDHSAVIGKMKSVIEQIEKPVYEARIRDFVRCDRFGDWLTSESSDALVVNNCSVNLSPGADGVSLLMELTLLLYDQLSRDKEAFTFLYLCAHRPADIGNMTTMQHMIRYLTSELYGIDCEHWNEQDFVREFSRGIRGYDPRNNKSDEKAHLIIDLFMDMLPKAQHGQTIYVLIDGFDLIEKDESRVNQQNFWQFFECLWDSIRDLQNSDEPSPVIKFLITYHQTCPEDTRGYWKEFVVDLPQPPETA